MTSEGPTVAEAFPFLRDMARETLSALAAAAGSNGGDLLDQPLGRVLHGPWAASFLQAVAEAALTAPLRSGAAAVARRPLVRLFPSISLLFGHGVPEARASVRLTKALRSQNLLGWHAIAGTTIEHLLLVQNLGKRSVQELLELLFEIGSEALLGRSIHGEGFERAGEEAPPAGWGSARLQVHGDIGPLIVASVDEPMPVPGTVLTAQALRLLRALKTIAAWASGEYGARTLVEAVTLAGTVTEEELPAEVAGAWRALSAVDAARLGGAERSSYDLDSATHRVLESLDEREREVFVSRRLRLERRLKLNEIGARYRVSRERARQIEFDARQKVNSCLQSQESAILRRAALRLREELGAAWPLDDFRAARPRFSTDAGQMDTYNFRIHLLLWLAGGYAIEGGWLVHGKLSRLRDESVRVLRDLTRGGPVPLEEALRAIQTLDIREQWARRWLDELGDFKVLDDVLARWGPTLADRIETVLRLEERPLRKEDILARVGRHSPASVTSSLGGDPRFRRRSRRHYGLAEWGGEEYSSIMEEMEKEIERAGGAARVDDLVARLRDRFGVSETSVRTYADGPQFMRLGPGMIRRRRPEDPRPGFRPIELNPRCFRLTTGWAYRIAVGGGIFRGSGTIIPPAFGYALGLEPGGAFSASTPFGKLFCSWPQLSPQIGSLRRAAAELGVETGDYLFVECLEPRSVQYVLVKRESLLQAQGDRRVAAEIGLDPKQWEGNILGTLAHAVGLEPDDVDLASLRDRLEKRREGYLLEYLLEEQQQAAGDLEEAGQRQPSGHPHETQAPPAAGTSGVSGQTTI